MALRFTSDTVSSGGSGRSQKFGFLFCLLLSGFVLPLTCSAQEQSQNQERPRRALSSSEQEPDEVLRIDTDLVAVDVTVTDAQGQPVRDLRAEDFKLFEDEAERPIAFYNVEKRGGALRPVAIVFALDVSGSMTPEELDRLQSAMNIFSKWLAADRSSLFAVMTFGMRVKTLQTFTSDGQKLTRAFERLPHEPNGLSTHIRCC